MNLKSMVSPCLPLLLTSSFVWTNDSIFTGEARIANFGKSDIKKAVLKWTLKYPDGKVGRVKESSRQKIYRSVVRIH